MRRISINPGPERSEWPSSAKPARDRRHPENLQALENSHERRRLTNPGRIIAAAAPQTVAQGLTKTKSLVWKVFSRVRKISRVEVPLFRRARTKTPPHLPKSLQGGMELLVCGAASSA
jgi:hypothetical protein